MIKLTGVNRHQVPPTSLKNLKLTLTELNGENLSDKLELAEGLFRKAPNLYLEKTSKNEQLQILDKVYTSLSTYRESKKDLFAEYFHLDGHEGLIGFTFILKDRPFIIDTISKYFSSLSYQPYCLLHPILEIDGVIKVSLTYLEIQLPKEHDLDSLLAEIRERLELLSAITDTFEIMTNKISKLKDSSKDPQAKALIDWLLDGGIIFLGTLDHTSGESLGILSDKQEFDTKEQLLVQLDQDKKMLLDSDRQIIFSKLKNRSPIHRSDYLEAISFKAENGNVVSLLGIFTSRTWKQEVASIPILKNKLSNILIEEGLIPSSHDYKELISLADTVPKSDFFQYSEAQIKIYFNQLIQAEVNEAVRIIHFTDEFKRLSYFTTILPNERYSATTIDQIEEILSSKLGISRQAMESHSTLGDHPLVLVRTAFPYSAICDDEQFIIEVQKLITHDTANWNDSIRFLLTENFDEEKASKLYHYYKLAFRQSYKASNSPTTALQDILMLEKLTASEPLDLVLEPIESYRSNPNYRLRIYKRGESLILSDIVPFLENLGLEVISEIISQITTEEAVWAEIYDITVNTKDGSSIDIKQLASNVIPSLKLILSKRLYNDTLNHLLLSPGLKPKEIAFCRAVGRYLIQLKLATSISSVANAYLAHPEIIQLLVQYFHAKFEPNESERSGPANESRIEKAGVARELVFQALKNITDSSHDKIIRSSLYVIDSMLRTNYYIDESSFKISFQIDCSLIRQMPLPTPYREIFVSASHFQGTHLRGGKVARGGLRWSSRKEDFRTEVLGLMKTQMVKNSIIVPVGAKGGFILHEEPKERDELLKAVESTYKEFIRGLLDITDNRIGKSIAHPHNVIFYDQADPYFVVAADRGTATFSDIANNIARDEYKFWLDDAFASGGSAGYDHKALGITAKGAWECAIRHFKELSIDIDTTEFSVVGIGDMSGDVFGNGLLLSKNAKLIAAFDHRHIFIDPNPNSKISFDERLRLFKLSRSSWADYSEELLSKGGAVYARSLKEINPSTEAKEILNLTEESYSPTELIKQILKAPCDLLWNGGIGTYVKASTEGNTDANDRANDELRIDANELKARIVAEGGNLGFTQRARIEYARVGGRINTDAVDNSGGVDTSDIEVNLKLLFRQAILDRKIKIEERDKALKACEEEVCVKVKDRNRSQSIILSISLKDSRENLSSYQDLIVSLESSGRLKRSLEFLPNKEELEKRKEAKAGLSRPELAVLVAYVKMLVFETVLESKLVEDPYLEKLLISYFPISIAEKYPELIKIHPLRKEIIATQIGNIIVEKMGAPFIFKIEEDLGSSLTNTVKAFLVAESILNTSSTAQELGVLDRANTSRFFLSSLYRIQTSIEAVTRWFINDESRKLPLNDLMVRYSKEFDTLVNHTDKILSGPEEIRYQESLRELLMHSIPADLARKLCSSQYATNYLDIIRVAENTNTKPLEIARLNSTISSELNISALLDISTSIHTEDKWESKALTALNNNLRQSASRISYRLIKELGGFSESHIKSYFISRQELLGRYRSTLKQIEGTTPSFSAIYVVGNLLRQIGKALIK